MSTEAKTIAELVDEVTKAKVAYESAQRQAAAFRSEETEALNNLNGAQKRLQKAMDAFVKDQPRESDFARQMLGEAP